MGRIAVTRSLQVSDSSVNLGCRRYLQCSKELPGHVQGARESPIDLRGDGQMGHGSVCQPVQRIGRIPSSIQMKGPGRSWARSSRIASSFDLYPADSGPCTVRSTERNEPWGKSLKKLLPAVIVAAILLSGCGGTEDKSPAASTATSTRSAAPVAAPVVERDPTAVTCEKFFTGDKSSPYFLTLYTMGEVQKLGPTATVPAWFQLMVARASNLLDTTVVSGTDELIQLVKAVNEPFVTLIAGSYDTSKMVAADHAGAVARLLAVCPVPSDAVTPTHPPAPVPTPTPTPTVTADPTSTVTYIVESDGPIELVTYTHFIGGSTAQEQDSAPAGGRVEKSYTFKSSDMFQKYGFWSLGVSGMAGPNAATISCSIILHGQVVSTQTSTGPYANVMCNQGSSS